LLDFWSRNLFRSLFSCHSHAKHLKLKWENTMPW